MKKMNRRTKVVILSSVMSVLLIAIYMAGILIPEELTASSFMNTKLPPSLQHPENRQALPGRHFASSFHLFSFSFCIQLLLQFLLGAIDSSAHSSNRNVQYVSDLGITHFFGITEDEWKTQLFRQRLQRQRQ